MEQAQEYLQEIQSIFKRELTTEEASKITVAYDLAQISHQGQIRASGEHFFELESVFVDHLHFLALAAGVQEVVLFQPGAEAGELGAIQRFAVAHEFGAVMFGRVVRAGNHHAAIRP